MLAGIFSEINKRVVLNNAMLAGKKPSVDTIIRATRVCCFLTQNFVFRTQHLRNSTIELTLKVLQSACRTLAQARFFQQRASALLMKTYWKWQHSLRPVKRDHFFHWPLSQSPTKITFGSKKWVYLLSGPQIIHVTEIFFGAYLEIWQYALWYAGLLGRWDLRIKRLTPNISFS